MKLPSGNPWTAPASAPNLRTQASSAGSSKRKQTSSVHCPVRGMTIDWEAGIVASMPRQLRVQYPGAICHLMSRGDRKKDIYESDVDRHNFLKTLAETCEKTGFQCRLSRIFHSA